MSQERDILKSLLLKEELEVLNQLKDKLLSEDRFTDEVAQVLSKAIKRAQKRDSQLEHALEKPIKAGVIRAFSESKQSIIDALLPIMGQLIRKTVINSIKQFVSDINRAIEQDFSIKSLKWRWQAKKAGITYPEMLFQKTIRYQVTDIFLINKDNGLLIEHAGSDDLLKDSNAISAMLTAIQSFIGDSFESSDAHLQSVEIENQNFIIATGPKVYLAAVVKGNPTERLKQKFQEVIENIHADYSDVLLQEETYQNNLELNDYLRGNLVTKSLSETQKETKLMPWVIVFLLIASALFYWSYSRKQALNDVIERSKKIEGLYVQKVEKEDDGYTIYGLLDPLADTSVFAGEAITFKTKPYSSLDESIVKRRIKQVLSHYGAVKSQFSGGHLQLSGQVSYKDNQLMLSKLYSINGVDEIDNKLTLTNPPVVEKKEDLSVFFDQVNQAFIQIPDKNNKSYVEAQLGFVIKNLQLLREKGIKIELSVIGTSDCAGILSDDYSMQRAKLVKEIISQSIKDNDFIKTTIRACTENKQAKNPSLLGVVFNLKNL